MTTKADMEGRVRRERSPRSGESKPQTYMWTCAAAKGYCIMREHPRIGCAVHGSKEEAEKCTARYLKAREESNGSQT